MGSLKKSFPAGVCKDQPASFITFVLYHQGLVAQSVKEENELHAESCIDNNWKRELVRE